MKKDTNRRRIARSLRMVRRIHRTLGVFLFAVFMVVAVTGVLLGWKKNSNGKIHPEAIKGTTTSTTDWLPMDSLIQLSVDHLHSIHGDDLDYNIAKIDVRPQKGMMKFIFKNHYYGVQIDGKTGDILQVTRRNSDLIEEIHDGSIIDKLLGTKGEIFKLIYSSIIGVSLLIFCLTGFWLWYGPVVMRKLGRKKS